MARPAFAQACDKIAELRQRFVRERDQHKGLYRAHFLPPANASDETIEELGFYASAWQTREKIQYLCDHYEIRAVLIAWPLVPIGLVLPKGAA